MRCRCGFVFPLIWVLLLCLFANHVHRARTDGGGPWVTRRDTMHRQLCLSASLTHECSLCQRRCLVLASSSSPYATTQALLAWPCGRSFWACGCTPSTPSCPGSGPKGIPCCRCKGTRRSITDFALERISLMCQGTHPLSTLRQTRRIIMY